jgi:hypothetical protein
MRKRLSTRGWPAVVLAAAFICGGALRAATAFTKPVFYHDESHSYQVATGHAGENARITYERRPPSGQWVQASEWKRLLRPERRFCFGTIGSDAHAFDVHPPLYYWLLHLACLAMGTHYWTGPLLNAFIDLFTIAAIFRLALLATGRDRLASAAAAFVWAAGAGALQVCVVEARQYSLLALIAVVFSDQVARFAGESETPHDGRRLRPFAIAALALAGALTHHHFALIIVGVLGWCVVTRRQARRRLMYATLAVGAAYLALLVIHPFFSGTGYKHLTDAKLPDPTGLRVRARQALEALAHVALERRYGSFMPLPTLTVIAAIVPLTFLAAWWTLRRRARASIQTPWAAGYATFLGVWIMLVTIALYLIGVTPAHAMSYRYLATMWPLLAVAAGIVFAGPAARARNGRGVLLIAFTCTIALISGIGAAYLQWHNLELDPAAPRAHELLRTGRRFVIDNVGRGHWPRPMWRIADDAQVIVAAPNDLLRRPAAWRTQLEPGALYISPAKSAAAAREKIVRLLRETHEVEFVAHVHAIGDVFIIGPPRQAKMPTPR